MVSYNYPVTILHVSTKDRDKNNYYQVTVATLEPVSQHSLIVFDQNQVRCLSRSLLMHFYAYTGQGALCIHREPVFPLADERGLAFGTGLLTAWTADKLFHQHGHLTHTPLPPLAPLCRYSHHSGTGMKISIADMALILHFYSLPQYPSAVVCFWGGMYLPFPFFLRIV